MPDIQSNEIELWFTEENQIDDQELLNEYRSLINDEELKRYERLVFPPHQKQFLVSRALLRTVLGQYLDQPPETLVFARNSYGKPRIASFEKSLPISFNLSHTDGLCVLAVTRENDLGVDVEYLTRKVDILNLAKRFFSEQEYAELAALDVEKFDERFFRLWTLKEAYIKACGMGLSISLKDFGFSFFSKKIIVNFAEERMDKPEFWQFWQFRFQKKFQIALAASVKQGPSKEKLLAREGRPLDKFEKFQLVDLLQN